MPGEAKDAKVLFAKKKREAEVNIMFQWSFVDSIFILIKLKKKKIEKAKNECRVLKNFKAYNHYFGECILYVSFSFRSSFLEKLCCENQLNKNIKARKAEPD